MRKATKRQMKAMEEKVEQAYYANCSGIQINIMDIGKVFAAGTKALQEGATDEGMAKAVVDFVETIRKN